MSWLANKFAKSLKRLFLAIFSGFFSNDDFSIFSNLKTDFLSKLYFLLECVRRNVMLNTPPTSYFNEFAKTVISFLLVQEFSFILYIFIIFMVFAWTGVLPTLTAKYCRSMLFISLMGPFIYKLFLRTQQPYHASTIEG